MNTEASIEQKRKERNAGRNNRAEEEELASQDLSSRLRPPVVEIGSRGPFRIRGFHFGVDLRSFAFRSVKPQAERAQSLVLGGDFG